MDKERVIKVDSIHNPNNSTGDHFYTPESETKDYVNPDALPFSTYADVHYGEKPHVKSFKGESTPYVCPVCGGKGIVPNGFYNSLNNCWSTTSTTPEICRTCGGSGVIWG